MNKVKTKKTGFTLIELVMVIIVIGIVWIIISIKFGTSVNISAQAKQLANDIRYAQNLAMARNQRYKLTTLGSRYKVQNNSSGYEEYNIDLGAGTSMTGYTIIFDTQGIPYDASSNPISSNVTITLSGAGETSNVTIIPTTGQVIP